MKDSKRKRYGDADKQGYEALLVIYLVMSDQLSGRLMIRQIKRSTAELPSPVISPTCWAGE